MAYRICFVCTGNICRSPMAEVVLRHEAASLGLSELVVADSAGTAADVGFGIDRRARTALEGRGYVPHRHSARQFDPAWFPERELVIALDRGHLTRLRSQAPTPELAGRVRLLLSFPVGLADAGRSVEIPDPYFGKQRDFESCLDLVQTGCSALLNALAADGHVQRG